MRNTIAIVTPAHPARIRNGMLDRALRSVYSQTTLPDQICVAVDNDHAGAAPTRDRALRMAETNWVAFLDSDDLFLPQHLEKLLGHALETGADYVYSWYHLLDASGKLHEHDDPIFPATHFTNPFNPDDIIETTITVLVRTELAKQIGFQPAGDSGGTNPGQNSGEDRRFTREAVRLGAKVSHLVERTWVWHHHLLPGYTDRLGNTSGWAHRGDGAL